MRRVGYVDISDYGVFTDAPEFGREVSAGIEESIEDSNIYVGIHGDSIRIILGFLGDPDPLVSLSIEEVVRENCLTKGLRASFIETLRKMIASAERLEYDVDEFGHDEDSFLSDEFSR